MIFRVSFIVVGTPEHRVVVVSSEDIELYGWQTLSAHHVRENRNI